VPQATLCQHIFSTSPELEKLFRSTAQFSRFFRMCATMRANSELTELMNHDRIQNGSNSAWVMDKVCTIKFDRDYVVN